jgi:hypothetical protein
MGFAAGTDASEPESLWANISPGHFTPKNKTQTVMSAGHFPFFIRTDFIRAEGVNTPFRTFNVFFIV